MANRSEMVGKRIRTLRMAKGISQNQMAQTIGISQTHMSNIESGRSNVTMENLFALHDVLQTRMADFFVDIDAVATAEQSNADALTIDDMVDALLMLKSRRQQKNE